MRGPARFVLGAMAIAIGLVGVIWFYADTDSSSRKANTSTASTAAESSTTSATARAEAPACTKDNAHAALVIGGDVPQNGNVTVSGLACTPMWAWGTVTVEGNDPVQFMLVAVSSSWSVVDLGSAICPTREGMDPVTAAQIVPAGQADCG